MGKTWGRHCTLAIPPEAKLFRLVDFIDDSFYAGTSIIVRVPSPAGIADYHVYVPYRENVRASSDDQALFAMQSAQALMQM
jgi:hypothetical protein